MWATSSSPRLPPFRAPVNAPSSWPNNSLSSRFSGTAAQFTAMKGLSARALALWMAWANSSFPVPLSPVISTVKSVRAKRCPASRARRKAALSPCRSAKRQRAVGCWRLLRCERKAVSASWIAAAS
jgi:hypothetical protein